MKKFSLSLLALMALSACQTTPTNGLREGDVYGTDIGSVVAKEAGLRLSSTEDAKMNSEIEKALFFSRNGLTTRWYAGYNARLRPLRNDPNRRDRECRRFRHGHQIDGTWYNATATACREYNVAWYLIANEWDQDPMAGRSNRLDRNRNKGRDYGLGRGRSRGDSSGEGWESLSETVRDRSGTPADDFSGPSW